MRVALSTLKQLINYTQSVESLAEQLTLAGFESSIIPSHFSPFEGVVVGTITGVTRHPNADRLNICDVNCGAFTKRIICGATNVREGLKVAVALVGAKLPKNFTIKPRIIRQHPSEGMICSVTELGLGTLLPADHTAPTIWEVPEDLLLGANLWQVLQLDEAILDIQIPPNRGDCLSVLGIAREIAALNNLPCKNFNTSSSFETVPASIAMEVLEKKACPRYTARIILDLNSNAQTPWKVLQRLFQGGMRSINPIVDITNYVLLEQGTPLHAFDQDQLQGKLEVRFARAGESIDLLNDKTVTLDPETLIVADEKGPLAIAGVMGGKRSAVTHTTQHILLESAYFSPASITSRARHYKLSTESSYRFERQVDPSRCRQALDYATQLMTTYCQGKVSEILELDAAHYLPTLPIVQLSNIQINRRLGLQLESKLIEKLLKQLGVKIVSTTSQGQTTAWTLQTPTWRFDLLAAVDIIEEIARLYGYERIPATPPTFRIRFQQIDTLQDQLINIRRFLVNQGFYEVINYSFISDKDQAKIDPKAASVELINPISQEMNVLRTQLFSGLLNTLKYNQQQQSTVSRFFEYGTVFKKVGQTTEELQMLSGIITGHRYPEQWSEKPKAVDFFDSKKIVSVILDTLDARGGFQYSIGKNTALHPNENSQILKNGAYIGWVGALHPSLYSAFELKKPVYLFSIHFPKPTTKRAIQFKPFARFPMVHRDIAFWIEGSISFDEVRTVIQKAAGKELVDFSLFDVYTEAKESHRRSLAIKLIWQHPERTLTDQEVDTLQQKVVTALEKTWAVQLRNV